jgi:hypothetical protein
LRQSNGVWRSIAFVPDPAVSMMQFLARFRVALGWVFAPLILILANPSRESIVVGSAVALCGEALRIWAAGHLNKAREVTSSGPYRYVAHPLYVGSSIIGLGLGLASRNLIAMTLIAVYLAVTLRAAIKSEERFLERTFGDQYELYRSWDRDGGPSARRSRRFSVALAMANREYRAVVGLLAAVLLLALKATYNASFGL